MIWNTSINKMTGTKYPLIMAAFAGLGRTEFAASFSNAGGLGIITGLNYKIGNFKSELLKMRELTDKPFGVNLTVLPPGVRTFDPLSHVSKEDYLKYLEIAIDEGIKVFTTSAYQATHLGERIKEAGCFWFHKCALLRHAISAERAGANAITLIGMEASGFKNPFQHTTLINITLAKRLLKTEDYHRKLYHRQLKSTNVLSAAIAHQQESFSINELIETIMNEAGEILKSWGFTGDEITFTS